MRLQQGVQDNPRGIADFLWALVPGSQGSHLPAAIKESRRDFYLEATGEAAWFEEFAAANPK